MYSVAQFAKQVGVSVKTLQRRGLSLGWMWASSKLRWFPMGDGLRTKGRWHRIYQCVVCSLVIDRDLNAALNLAWFAAERLRQLHAQVDRPG